MQLNLDLSSLSSERVDNVGKTNRMGYSYVQVNVLIEIDNDNGKTRTVDFASYPVKQDNWQFQRFKKRLQTDKKKQKGPKKFTADIGETEVEEI